jgi:hypothetical protein
LTKPAKGINFNTKLTDNIPREPKENPTMNHKATAALSLLALALAFILSCKEAVIPLMSRDVDGVALAPSYLPNPPFGETSSSPSITTYKNFPVNPAGVSIRSVTQTSDGVTNIILTGQVNSTTSIVLRDTGGTQEAASAGGIPAGLHSIATPAAIVTDYPIPVLPDPYPRYAYPADHPFARQPLDIPLEDQISLASISKNSNYTALTFSGMVLSRSGVRVDEFNESLRLSAQLRPFYNTAINTNAFPAERSMYFYNDPNLFLLNGSENRDVSAGRPRGGFDVLIWDGAAKKTAAFAILYDGDRTPRRFLVDWNAVSFENVPLQYMAWYNTPSPTLPEGVTVSAVGPTSGYNSIYTVTVTGVGKMATATSIDNFVTPSFYPANATNRSVSITSGYDTGDFDVEIADRIKVTRNPTSSKGYAGTFEVVCQTYPPSDIPVPPTTLVVTLTY